MHKITQSHRAQALAFNIRFFAGMARRSSWQA